VPRGEHEPVVALDDLDCRLAVELVQEHVVERIPVGAEGRDLFAHRGFSEFGSAAGCWAAPLRLQRAV
jgi:hypothetical protein